MLKKELKGTIMEKVQIWQDSKDLSFWFINPYLFKINPKLEKEKRKLKDGAG